MATLKTSATAYRGSYTPLGNCVGYEQGLGTSSVMRYKFTTDEKGATKISFKTSAGYLAHSIEGDTNAPNTIAKIRFTVTTQATGYEKYNGSQGTLCQYSYGKYISGELEIDLLPNTDYYLWIFPNFHGFAVWGIGSCTVTTEGLYGQPSTITASDGYLGENIPITLNRGLDVMLHTVKVSCAGIITTLIENSSEYPTITWKPSLEEYAPLIINASYAEATITAETFLNGNSLGESSKTISVKIPDNELLPQINDGWVSAAPYNTDAAEDFTVYISAYSRAQVNFDESKIDMSNSMGGSIAGFEIICNGSTVKESPYITPVLSAEANIVCSVIDSRGRKVGTTLNITPLPYTTPSLTQISVQRCDEGGVITEDGYCHKVAATVIYSALSGQNSYTLQTAYRNLQGSYGEYSEFESGVPEIIYGTSPDASYEIRIVVKDKLGNGSSATRRLPTRQWAMKFREDAQGVAFGKAPEFSNALELPETWTIRRGLTDEVVWGADGKISRAQLAADALYSPVKLITSTPYTLSMDDVGKTLAVADDLNESDVIVNISQEASTSLPTGYTVAFYWYFGKSLTVNCEGLALCFTGEDAKTGSNALNIPEQGGLFAMQKMHPNTEHDYWKVTGEVEVV